MAFTTEQVAAYFRDQKLDAAGQAKAAKSFGVTPAQMAAANAMLASGNTAGVNAASNAYAAAVTPEQEAKNLAFYNPSTNSVTGLINSGGTTTTPTVAPIAPATPVAPAQQLATAMQGMIAGGNEAGAKALYNDKQSQLGFTDADMAPYTANMGVAGSNGFDSSQINAWKAPPTIAPVAVAAPASHAQDVVATTDTGPVATAEASTATPAANVVATPAVASTYTAQHADAALQAPAAQWSVTAPQTVQGQVEQIIAKNSPLQQQAESLATQRMNGRGLINTSINTEAGMNALYQNALQMAQPDAATYADSAKTNAGATNQVNALNAQLGTNVNLQNAGFKNEGMKFNATMATDVSKTNVANALQAGIVNQAQANDLSKFNANLLTTVDLSNVKDANEFQQFALKQAFDAKVINQDQYNKLSIFNADSANKAAIAQLSANTSIANTATTTAAQAAIAKLQADTSTANTTANLTAQTAIANLNNEYGAQANETSSGTRILESFNTGVAAIIANDKLDGAAMQTAIELLTRNTENAMRVIDAVGGLDLSAWFQ